MKYRSNIKSRKDRKRAEPCPTPTSALKKEKTKLFQMY